MEKFLTGISAKKPNERAPKFVIASVSINRDKLLNTLKGMSDEWINLDLKESRQGTYYLQINDYRWNESKKEKENAVAYDGEVEEDVNDIPF